MRFSVLLVAIAFLAVLVRSTPLCPGGVIDACHSSFVASLLTSTTQGICNGDSTSCADCAGTPNGNAELDLCGVCNGDDSSCSDCAGVPNGNAKLDDCGVCNGANLCKQQQPLKQPQQPPAFERPSSASLNRLQHLKVTPLAQQARRDVAPVHKELESRQPDEPVRPPLDCAGVPYGTSRRDACGVCNGDGTSCLDCAGVSFGGHDYDVCDVCGGDGSSCADCLGVPHGTAKFDSCGECGGDGTSCIDCNKNCFNFARCAFSFLFSSNGNRNQAEFFPPESKCKNC